MDEVNECLYQIRQGISGSEYGYKIQAIAAHVLIRLGFKIEKINSSGHPDIIAGYSGQRCFFEVEVEISSPSLRKLTDIDLNVLLSTPGVLGYYALAVELPSPHWIIVPAIKLSQRARRSPKSLLEALSDKGFSSEWTREYIKLLRESFHLAKYSTFSALCEKALSGKSI